MSEEELKTILRKADAVCFDVDSTVIKEEGTDELAKFLGKFDQVCELTKQAMAGFMDFRTSMTKRLNILKPSLKIIQDFQKAHKTLYTDGIKDLIDRLRKKGVDIYFISGGLKIIIDPLAEALQIPKENVIANELKFTPTGDYDGFNADIPVSKGSGKAVVIKDLKEKHGYETVIMIGDGFTDLQASPPAEAFIGYGGVIVREEVKSKSKWFITDFQDLIKLLD